MGYGVTGWGWSNTDHPDISQRLADFRLQSPARLLIISPMFTDLLNRRVAARPHQKPQVTALVLPPRTKVVEEVREHFRARVGQVERLDCPATRDFLARSAA